MDQQDKVRERADRTFWSEIFTLQGSVTPLVFGRVLWFGLIAGVLTLLDWLADLNLGNDLGPYEVASAVLGVLLVFRTNAGYDRWYEGRRMFGLIVNNSRNLAVTLLTHGPHDAAWRETAVRWIAAFGHVSRATLRGQGLPREVVALVGQAGAAEIGRSAHMPTFVALRIGELLEKACTELGMDRLGFLEADRERAALIEYEGACERIRSTPIPTAYSINMRRLIFLYLLAVPFALLDHLGDRSWLAPLFMMLVSYPVLSMDQIGAELERPFDVDSLNHLPLDELTDRLAAELLGLLAASNDGPGQDHAVVSAAPNSAPPS